MTYFIEVYEKKNVGEPDLLGEYEFEVPPKAGDLIHPPGSKNYGVLEGHHAAVKTPTGERPRMSYRLLVKRL